MGELDASDRNRRIRERLESWNQVHQKFENVYQRALRR
jgi:hypothetical protein